MKKPSVRQPPYASRSATLRDGDWYETWSGERGGERHEAIVLPDAVLLHSQPAPGQPRRAPDQELRLTHPAFCGDPAGQDWVRERLGQAAVDGVLSDIRRHEVIRQTGRAVGPDNFRKEPVKVGEATVMAWIVGGSTASTTCFFNEEGLVLRTWHYHPQYDQEPETGEQCYPLSSVEEGEAARRLLAEFGLRAYDEILAEVHRRQPPRQATRWFDWRGWFR